MFNSAQKLDSLFDPSHCKAEIQLYTKRKQRNLKKISKLSKILVNLKPHQYWNEQVENETSNL